MKMTQKEKAMAWDELVRSAEIDSKKDGSTERVTSVTGKMILVVIRVVKNLIESNRLWTTSTGPWVVVTGWQTEEETWPIEFLTLLSSSQWSLTLILSKAERFPRLRDAKEWARVVGGTVVPESEVGK